VVDRPAVRVTPPRLADCTFQRGLRASMGAFTRHGDLRYRAELSLRLHADGTPDSATVRLTRAAGSAALDTVVLALVPRMRYHPATVNGIPIRFWVRQPVHVEMTY
jgi:TonB family protein